MRKTGMHRDATGKGRVLARVLAEDLRNIRGGGTQTLTISRTFVGGTGDPDVSNVDWDGDTPPPI